MLDRQVRTVRRNVDVTGMGDLQPLEFERTIVRSFEATAKVLTAVAGADTAFRESKAFRSTALGLDCLDEAQPIIEHDLLEFRDLIAARRMVVHLWMTVGERYHDVVSGVSQEHGRDIPMDWRFVGPDGTDGPLSAKFFNGAVFTTGAGIGRGEQLTNLIARILPEQDALRAQARMTAMQEALGLIESRHAA
jgi:hypothetical protein